MISSSHSGRYSAIVSPIKGLLPLVILLIGAYFRMGGLSRDSLFFADEALFGSYARQMVIEQDWLLYDVPTDKPPTTYVLVGLSLWVWGESEFSARIPNVYLSILGLAVFYALAKRVNPKAATICTLLYALSPLDISYAATVFQDPPMLTCVLLGVWLAVQGRWRGAGWGLGLACAMKPTALWIAPLIVGIALVRGATSPVPTGRLRPRPLLVFATGLVTPMLLLILWDIPRGAPSFFTLGSRNNNPGRLIRADEVIPRAETWLHIWIQTVGHAWLGGVLLIVGGVWLVVMARKQVRVGLMMWLVAGFLVWYIGAYWLIAFSPWDRYVLLVSPFALLIAGQGLTWVIGRGQYALLTTMLIISLISWPAAERASQRPADITSIDRLANRLNRELAGTDIFDNWLGWYLLWYLGADSQVDVLYFATPEDLAAYLQREQASGYLIAPDKITARPWLAILDAVGVESQLALQEGEYVVYYLGLRTK